MPGPTTANVLRPALSRRAARAMRRAAGEPLAHGRCGGESCANLGRSRWTGYPYYYLVQALERRRGRIIGEVTLCEDCWSEVVLERQKKFDRDMNPRPVVPPAEGDPAADEPRLLEDLADDICEAERRRGPRSEINELIEHGGMQFTEAKLPPESTAALQSEIGRYLATHEQAKPIAVRFGQPHF